jgi:hypothetical protein
MQQVNTYRFEVNQKKEISGPWERPGLSNLTSKDLATDGVFSQFRTLRKAFVDASSIIYMHRAGFLEEVSMAVKLYAPQEIIEETDYDGLPVCPVTCPMETPCNDQKLIACALAQGTPVISEDKRILSHMDKEGVPYFNALMMLHFLLFREVVTTERHFMYFHELKRYAWYSDSVLEFAEKVYHAIVPYKDGGGLQRAVARIPFLLDQNAQ